MSKYSCSVWPYIQYFLPTSQVEILPLLQNSWYFFPSTIHIPARSGCSFHSTKVISTMQILIFQSAHKRNLYISQKIFGPSHKRYPPCPSHWWIFPQTISQEIFPLPISQEISQEIFLSQEILPQIITKEIFPLTISQEIFHLRIYNPSAHLTRDSLRPSLKKHLLHPA